jgi:hypothetical protein
VTTHLAAIVLVTAITVVLSTLSLAIGILRDEKKPELCSGREGVDRFEGRSRLNY